MQYYDGEIELSLRYGCLEISQMNQNKHVDFLSARQVGEVATGLQMGQLCIRIELVGLVSNILENQFEKL